MTLKCIATGSNGNCYILTSDSGKHLILDAGVPISEIKQGLDYDIEKVEGCVISHSHKDHVLSANKIEYFSPVWHPYLSENKREHTHIGEFDIQTFFLPHDAENRGFIIKVGNQTICYMTDFEYCQYNLSSLNISTMIISLNYQEDMIEEIGEHERHVIKDHSEEKTVIEILKQNVKSLKNVILIHMSNSGYLDRNVAMERIRKEIPEYINVYWAKPGETYNISEIPF